MNFQQLRSVRETVRRNFNLTEVASALYTSQPGVSRQIRELEEELGVEIFERAGKRLIGLTPPGEEIVRIAERLLAEAANLKQAADEFAGRDQGRLVIATTHTQARYALPPVIAAFRERYPEVTLALQQASPAHIVELLRSGEADIGFASEALAQQPDFVVFEAYRWHHVVLAPRDHPLANKQGLRLQDLADYPLITYDGGFTGRQRIDEAFTSAGVTPRIVLTAMDSDVIKTYVELGMGIGIVAGMAWDPVKDSQFARIDEPGLFGENAAMIGVRRSAYLRRFALDFIQQLAPQYSREALSASVFV